MHGRWIGAAVLALAVAACGGSSGPGTGGGSVTSAPSSATQADDPGTGSTGNTGGDAPVSVTVGGITQRYDVGTCDVAEADDLYADAATSAMSFQSVNIRISDASGASLRAIVPLADDAPPLQLFAGDPRPDTSWDVSVEGTTAVIEARMFDESPSAGDDPFHDVTITIRCAERGFGGMAPATDEPEAPPAEEPAPTAVPTGATVTLDLGGSVSTFDYFGCPLTEPELMFVILDVTGTRLAVVRGEAQVDLADGTRYRAQGVDFGGSDSSGSWSGTLASPAGDVPATITIACG